MALLFIDSFDHYATADIAEKWTTVGGSAGTTDIMSTEGRRGGGALKSSQSAANSTTAAVSLAVTPSGTTMVTGFAVKSNGLNTDYPLFHVGTAAGWHIGLFGTSSTGLNVRRGNNYSGTVLGTVAVPLTLNTYVYVEVKVTIHSSAGVVEVRFDGAPVLTLSGINTQDGTAGAGWTRVGYFTSQGTVRFDDVYLLDGSGVAPWNTFIGDCRVDARLPTAAGASSGWTPSAGSNWQNVDDSAPDDDTTYNSAASTGLTDTFVVQDAAVAGATIYGVQVNLSAKKSDSGTCSIASVVRQSGSNQVATAQSPGTSYAYLRTVYQTNPHTSAQWTESDFNADEFGYSRTA